jgi:hypothetical protein
MRRRRAANPIQVGDRVVIVLELGRLTGQVLSRDSSGRLLIALDSASRGVHVRIDHRRARRLADTLRMPVTRKPGRGRFAG